MNRNYELHTVHIFLNLIVYELYAMNRNYELHAMNSTNKVGFYKREISCQ